MKGKFFLLCILTINLLYSTQKSENKSKNNVEEHIYDCYGKCENLLCKAHKRAYHELNDQLKEEKEKSESENNFDFSKDESEKFEILNITEHPIQDGKLKEKIEKLQEENDQLKSENDQLKSENDNLTKEIEEKSKPNEEVSKKIQEEEKMKEENAPPKKTEISIQTSNEEAMDSNNDYQNKEELTQLRKEIESLKAENEELKQKAKKKIDLNQYKESFMVLYDKVYENNISLIHSFLQTEQREKGKKEKEINELTNIIEKNITDNIFKKSEKMLEMMQKFMNDIEKIKEDDDKNQEEIKKIKEEFYQGLQDNIEALTVQHGENKEKVIQGLTDFNNNLLDWVSQYPERLGILLEGIKSDQSNSLEKNIDVILKNIQAEIEN